MFLVSCKYMSRVLANPSPAHLFERDLSDRGGRTTQDWYAEVASDAYNDLYTTVRDCLSLEHDLPDTIDDLRPSHRRTLVDVCSRVWPAPAAEAYRRFSQQVSEASAIRWRAAVERHGGPETLLWRMLRLNSSPYYVLSTSRDGFTRLRIGTPWDWRRSFRLVDFSIEPEDAGQPRVRWRAAVSDSVRSVVTDVRGHVEIRWSHGRFCGNPEAKLYLDSPIHEVPGYFPLV